MRGTPFVLLLLIGCTLSRDAWGKPINADDTILGIVGRALGGSDKDKAEALSLVLELLAEIDLPSLCSAISRSDNHLGSVDDIIATAARTYDFRPPSSRPAGYGDRDSKLSLLGAGEFSEGLPIEENQVEAAPLPRAVLYRDRHLKASKPATDNHDNYAPKLHPLPQEMLEYKNFLPAVNDNIDVSDDLLYDITASAAGSDPQPDVSKVETAVPASKDFEKSGMLTEVNESNDVVVKNSKSVKQNSVLSAENLKFENTVDRPEALADLETADDNQPLVSKVPGTSDVQDAAVSVIAANTVEKDGLDNQLNETNAISKDVDKSQANNKDDGNDVSNKDKENDVSNKDDENDVSNKGDENSTQTNAEGNSAVSKDTSTRETNNMIEGDNLLEETKDNYVPTVYEEEVPKSDDDKKKSSVLLSSRQDLPSQFPATETPTTRTETPTAAVGDSVVENGPKRGVSSGEVEASQTGEAGVKTNTGKEKSPDSAAFTKIANQSEISSETRDSESQTNQTDTTSNTSENSKTTMNRSDVTLVKLNISEAKSSRSTQTSQRSDDDEINVKHDDNTKVTNEIKTNQLGRLSPKLVGKGENSAEFQPIEADDTETVSNHLIPNAQSRDATRKEPLTRAGVIAELYDSLSVQTTVEKSTPKTAANENGDIADDPANDNPTSISHENNTVKLMDSVFSLLNSTGNLQESVNFTLVSVNSKTLKTDPDQELVSLDWIMYDPVPSAAKRGSSKKESNESDSEMIPRESSLKRTGDMPSNASTEGDLKNVKNSNKAENVSLPKVKPSPSNSIAFKKNSDTEKIRTPEMPVDSMAVTAESTTSTTIPPTTNEVEMKEFLKQTKFDDLSPVIFSSSDFRPEIQWWKPLSLSATKQKERDYETQPQTPDEANAIARSNMVFEPFSRWGGKEVDDRWRQVDVSPSQISAAASRGDPGGDVHQESRDIQTPPRSSKIYEHQPGWRSSSNYRRAKFSLPNYDSFRLPTAVPVKDVRDAAVSPVKDRVHSLQWDSRSVPPYTPYINRPVPPRKNWSPYNSRLPAQTTGTLWGLNPDPRSQGQRRDGELQGLASPDNAPIPRYIYPDPQPAHPDDPMTSHPQQTAVLYKARSQVVTDGLEDSNSIRRPQKTDWLDAGPSEQLPPRYDGYVCPGLFGYYGDIMDCRSFFICSWGVPHRFYCPRGTAWNPTESVCDWSIEVDCTPTLNLNQPITF